MLQEFRKLFYWTVALKERFNKIPSELAMQFMNAEYFFISKRIILPLSFKSNSSIDNDGDEDDERQMIMMMWFVTFRIGLHISNMLWLYTNRVKSTIATESE